jgi:hypothetical protein
MRVNPSEKTNHRTQSGLEVMMSTTDWIPLATRIDLCDPGTILEYGSGISTVAIADVLTEHPKHRLVSVEHDAEWYAHVNTLLENHPAREQVRLIHAPLDFHPSIWRYAHPAEETGAGAAKYIHPLSHELGEWFDVRLAFVDGIARGPCLATCWMSLEPGTPVFLHDYRGREEWYDWALQAYERVELYDLMLELRVPSK